MLQAGHNITSTTDTLAKIQPEYFYNQIKSPKKEILAQINRLRVVKSIDSKQFSALKKQLPYVVCGIFNPPYRKTENFGYIEYFIVDLDHITVYNHSIDEIKNKLMSDKRVVMLFISPSEDGLKIMFRLKEKCFDAGKYSIFYKKMVHSFSLEYGLEELIDTRTSDATRACFVSYDENAYFNETAEAVDMSNFINFEDSSSIKEIRAELKAIENEKEEKEKNNIIKKTDSDPDKEAMAFIRSQLNPKMKTTEKKEAYVPAILNDIIDDLKEFLEHLSFTVSDIQNIQYGKKISLTLGNKKAEINLFYGKRGFSIIQSPKCGTSSEVNELAYECISNYLLERGY